MSKICTELHYLLSFSMSYDNFTCPTCDNVTPYYLPCLGSGFCVFSFFFFCVFFLFSFVCYCMHVFAYIYKNVYD